MNITVVAYSQFTVITDKKCCRPTSHYFLWATFFYDNQTQTYLLKTK